MTSPATAPAPVLLGLTGFARSGKDTVGRVLVGEHGFRRVAFGDTLKAVAEDLNSPVEYTDGSGRYRVRDMADILAEFGGWEGAKDAVPETRAYLVDLGNSLRKRIPGIEIAASFGSVGPGERVVNTNVYHPEEIDSIQSMGGFVIRVVRPGFTAANADEERTGAHPVDAVLVNRGGEEDLSVSVARLLADLGVLPAADAA